MFGLDPHEIVPLAVQWDSLTSGLFWVNVGILAGIYALLALGLQLNVGFTGITNFGQAGFMAIGGYTMAILTVDTGLGFWLSLPLSMLAAILFGLLVGLPSLRLREDYFAIATIASAELVRIVAQNAQSLTGGNQGFFCNDDQTKCFDDTWLDVSDTIEGWFQDLGWAGPGVAGPTAAGRDRGGDHRHDRPAADPEHALGPGAEGDPRGPGRRPGAGQERLRLQAPVAGDLGRDRLCRRLVPGPRPGDRCTRPTSSPW